MLDRSPAHSFGKTRNHHHKKPTVWNICLLFWHEGAELIRHIPTLIQLRKFYKNRIPNKKTRVVIFSDNLDEVNGIAINARLVVQYLRSQNRDLRLVGTAFHTRSEGVIEKNGTVLLPQRFSIEMPGYDHNELAVPSLIELTRYLRHYPVDLVELETPGPGSWLALTICKIVGIPVLSHYRTDILAYTKLLVDNQIIWYITRFLTSTFCRLSTPVIVPSEDFRKKMKIEMGLKNEQIVKLPRGIALEHVYPDLAEKKNWNQFFPQSSNKRFLFVGRVSREKELPFLEEVWREFRKKEKDIELLIVGAGPYLTEMKERMSDLPEVRFSGQQEGEKLFSLYAEADCFVFPSGTDTFGNVVVESLAAGTPALVSDSGGPRDIIENEKSGYIIPLRNKEKWVSGLQQVCQLISSNHNVWKLICDNAHQRSKNYSLQKASQTQWEFYEKHLASLVHKKS